MSNFSILQDVIDVEITSCVIYSSTMQATDVFPILAEINYYEDMFSNCITGNIVLSDSIGLSSKSSWCGEEYLILGFTKNEDKSAEVKRTFKIYSLTNRVAVSTTNENYILNFCSEELLLGQKIRISKTYKDKRISDIVKDIALNYLKIDPKEFPDSNIETTKGTYNITIPNLRPFQAINWLCTLAISDSLQDSMDTGATYLFWQNKTGFNFKPILGIFNNVEKNYYKGWKGSGFYWYGIKNFDPNLNIGDFGDIDRTDLDDSQQILSYENLNSFDSLESIRKGIFSNRSIGLDFVTRTYTKISFDYEKYFSAMRQKVDLYKNDGKYSLMSDTQDRFNKKLNEYQDSNIRIFPTTTGQNRNQFVSKNQNEIKDYNIEYTIPYRAAQFGLLGYNRFKITVPGDPKLITGKLIYVYIPQTTVDDSKSTQPENRFLSGYYLISAIRHIINKTGDYKTVLEIRKDSYNIVKDGTGKGGLSSYGTYDSTLNTIRRTGIF